MMLHGTYDDQNIFAKVLRSEAPAVPIFETEWSLAFLDIFPQSEGHTLVIPKKSKARNLLEVEADSLTRLILDVQTVARGVAQALNPDGIVITQFNGAPAGQTVFHLHVHIIPRWSDRALAPHGRGAMADPQVLEPLAARIRAGIAEASKAETSSREAPAP